MAADSIRHRGARSFVENRLERLQQAAAFLQRFLVMGFRQADCEGALFLLLRFLFLLRVIRAFHILLTCACRDFFQSFENQTESVTPFQDDGVCHLYIRVLGLLEIPHTFCTRRKVTPHVSQHLLVGSFWGLFSEDSFGYVSDRVQVEEEACRA